MIIFVSAIITSLCLTLLVRKLALKYKVVDVPDKIRKFHSESTPLLGGVAIYSAFWLILGILLLFTNFIHKNLSSTVLLAIFLASTILVVVGVLDDRYGISPKIRLLITAFAAIIVIVGGTNFSGITNPFGGIIGLDMIKVGNFLILANLVVFFWLVGMTYTVKILDGLDGLAVGIALIAFLMIYFLTASGKFFQPDVSLVSSILAGVCAGFLILNFHPAAIYLGESGGLFLGFMLGVVAVVAGGKFATALLVLAVPILDLARVIYLRFKISRPIFEGDREHLHFQLLDLGLTHLQAVMILYFIALVFGLTTLFLSSWGKLSVLFILTVGMIFFGVFLTKKEQLQKKYDAKKIT